MQHLYPQPSATHIENVQKLYKGKCGVELTEEEAREVLIRVIRFLWFGARPMPDSEGSHDSPPQKDGAGKVP